jgi:hypothetical protein
MRMCDNAVVKIGLSWNAVLSKWRALLGYRSYLNPRLADVRACSGIKDLSFGWLKKTSSDLFDSQCATFFDLVVIELRYCDWHAYRMFFFTFVTLQ